jgi:hypothetical protein
MSEKACSKCRIVKPLEAYDRNRNKSDGRESECSDCRRARQAAKREPEVAVERKEPTTRKSDDPKATVRRQHLFNVEARRAPRQRKEPSDYDVRYWWKISNDAERAAAHAAYLRALAPRPVMASDGVTRLDD